MLVNTELPSLEHNPLRSAVAPSPQAHHAASTRPAATRICVKGRIDSAIKKVLDGATYKILIMQGKY